jgi:hypothetical protein
VLGPGCGLQKGWQTAKVMLRSPRTN